MPPVIRIPDTTYQRLQALGTPFSDTPASVIERLLDAYEVREDVTVSTRKQSQDYGATIRELDCDDPGDLRHTRVVRARFGDAEVRSWAELLRAAAITAVKVWGGVQEAQSKLRFTIIAEGSCTDRGYHPVPGEGFSVQNKSASDTWAIVLDLARHFRKEVDVVLRWLNRHEAAFPGQEGHLHWGPANKDRTPPAREPEGEGWRVKGVLFPNGTEFRAKHKGQTYAAVGEGRGLVVSGKRYGSPSAAASSITEGPVNGWVFWQARLPGHSGWRVIASFRD